MSKAVQNHTPLDATEWRNVFEKCRNQISGKELLLERITVVAIPYDPFTQRIFLTAPNPETTMKKGHLLAGGTKFGFVRGGVDPGETDIITAIRELREEAGLKLLKAVDAMNFCSKFIGAPVYPTVGNGSDAPTIYRPMPTYLVTCREKDLTGDPEDNEENRQGKWVSINDLEELSKGNTAKAKELNILPGLITEVFGVDMDAITTDEQVIKVSLLGEIKNAINERLKEQFDAVHSISSLLKPNTSGIFC